MPGDTPESKGPQKPSLSWSQPTSTAPAHAPVQAQKPVQKEPVKHASATPTPAAKTNKNVIWWVVGGLIVLGLIIWGLVALHNQNTQIASNSTTTASGATTTVGTTTLSSGFLTVASPQAAGTEVSVANVSVTSPTWVVVYEDKDGAPGNALGAGLFFSPSQGGATSGTVTLLRGTIAGQMYLVGESQDNGDRVFSLQSDKAVTDVSGKVLWAQFTAQ